MPSKAPQHIEQAVQDLLRASALSDEEKAIAAVSAVHKQLRARYSASERGGKNPECTLMSKMSLVKGLYMDATPGKGEANEHPTLRRSIAALKELIPKVKSEECRQNLKKFVDASTPLKARYKEWKRSRTDDFCVDMKDEPEVLRVFKDMKILPAAMDHFHLDIATFRACMRKSTKALEEKNETAAVVNNADAVLDRLRDLVRERSNMFRLLVGLLGCSGRRTTEVASQRSAFCATSHPQVVMFRGQLKRNSLHEAPPFPIPIIGVTAREWLDALAALREDQGPMPEDQTNRGVSVRFQSNSRKQMLKHITKDFPGLATLHDLRSFYAAVVYKSFDWKNFTFPRVVKQVLGHTSMKQFFNYNALQVSGLSVHYGPFPQDVSTDGPCPPGPPNPPSSPTTKPQTAKAKATPRSSKRVVPALDVRSRADVGANTTALTPAGTPAAPSATTRSRRAGDTRKQRSPVQVPRAVMEARNAINRAMENPIP